ncbi:uncharacterized protein LOC142225184 [Haematobia irritans]|uniref:uncharacterized protein LOC142225184 n=1 Tax=Haematobia irritans TaxID=7368 RepID=UPI003F50C7DF
MLMNKVIPNKVFKGNLLCATESNSKHLQKGRTSEVEAVSRDENNDSKGDEAEQNDNFTNPYDVFYLQNLANTPASRHLGIIVDISFGAIEACCSTSLAPCSSSYTKAIMNSRVAADAEANYHSIEDEVEVETSISFIIQSSRIAEVKEIEFHHHRHHHYHHLSFHDTNQSLATQHNLQQHYKATQQQKQHSGRKQTPFLYIQLHTHIQIYKASNVLSVKAATEDLHALEAARVELNTLWDQVRRAYINCRDRVPVEGETPIDKDKLRGHYKNGMDVYKTGLSTINSQISARQERENQEKLARESLMTQNMAVDPNSTPNLRLPPCDTDIFKGGYSEWPTFRDLFAAIYINNPRLSKVEKLFHLTQKTSGEAREIITNVPLTNEGFDIAWRNLENRYENKRMQVNEQLRILFNLPTVSVENASTIQKLQRTINTCTQTLETLLVDTGEWDPILVYLVSTKLPRTFLEEFENSLEDCSTLPSWQKLDDFLSHKFKTLESVGNIKIQNSKHNQSRSDNDRRGNRVNSFHTNVTQKHNPSGSRLNNNNNNSQANHNSKNINNPSRKQSESVCPICRTNHLLRNCPKFLEKSPNDRIQITKQNHLCYNCLLADHGVRECKSRYSCRECNQRHHSLLHKGNVGSAPTNTTHTRDAAQSSASAVALNTLIHRVRDGAQPSTSAAALNTFVNQVQGGAQSSASAATCSTLVQSSISSSIQSTSTNERPSITTLTLQEDRPTPRPETTLLFTAIVQIESKGQRYDARAIIDPGSQSTFISERIKNRLQLPTVRNLVHVTGLSDTVAETSTKACVFNLCSRIDPTFELEVWAPVLKTLPSNLPTHTLDRTLFDEFRHLRLADPQFFDSRPVDMLIGLDIGPFIYTHDVPMKSFGSILAQDTVFGWIVGGPIQQNIETTRKIALHSASSLEKIITPEDIYCETNYTSTTKRNEAGRYIVTLPFKSCAEIGASRNIALAQFHRMEKKLARTPDIKAEYDAAIREYLQLGHMRKVDPQNIYKTPHYYLPHHAVIKPDRTTTKLRVVFNASSPTSNKKSLNDILHTGPILQQDLVLQILKWRFFKYVFNADVTKMYRQILIDPNQASFQRILFRFSENGPVEDFELLTVTFGVNCAPFLAIRTLLQLAEDVQDSYPLGSKIIKENLYVDDVLAGGHTIEDTIAARKQLTSVLDSAGFELRKWTSNDPRLLNDLHPDLLLPVNWLDLSEGSSTKTLGIRWNVATDAFSFKAPNVEERELFTKREVLSTIAKFFDPCGWLAPIIIVAKLVMQQVWLDKIGWDDTLRPVTTMNWRNFVKNSPIINTISVPRWIRFSPSSAVEIHGFCDASGSAYAATLYIRVEIGNQVDTFLLAAKTRVAPIKKISLPRLELCGAVMLSKLANAIIPNLQIAQFTTHFWTDSTIVLAWLRKPPCSWSTFVGNRVSEILESVGNENWNHVDSESNPADIASRGCSPDELKEHHLWWTGPEWLKLPRDRWPKTQLNADTNLEAKQVKVFATTVFEDPLTRFSSLSRAYRVLSYVIRFWRNTGSNRSRIASEDISSSELNDIKTRLIIVTQKHYFAEEYLALTQKKRLSPSSSILSFNPFIDSKGVLRSNGRLVQSQALTYSERHPILIPYDSRFALLFVEFVHKVTMHGGNQLMVRVIRSEFWIFRVKQLVKKVIHNCRICSIHRHRTQTQIMASLPPERTMLSRPFQNTGVDFAGPFGIKSLTARACLITKGYVCIFVCFSTRAIHLEATSDLSTQSFIAALDRFIGRRGCPEKIFSDNGKNFIGAAELIKKDRIAFMKSIQDTTIQRHAHQNLEWKFIPPGAPHMGGLWEAGVKSFKTHLRKTMPKMNFTFEELSTILARIEACLNSRPISPTSDDLSDLEPLTPGHFLIGSPLLTPAEPDISGGDVTLINRWTRLKVISQNFCQRWKSEYLNELHRRYKWKYPQQNLAINDLVIIKDDHLPSNEWKLGRVVKTYEGADKNIRVVDIKTASGMLSRPITKIVKLFAD